MIFLYIERETFFHRLDPRTKLFFLFVMLVAFLSLPLPYFLIPALITLVLLFFTHAVTKLKPLLPLLLIILLFSTFVWGIKGDNDILFFNYENLLFGFLTGWRIDFIMLAGLLFLATTRNEEIFAALLKLHLPYAFSFAFSTALRLLPSFTDTGFTILKAQRTRGLIFKGGIIARLKSYIPLITPLFLLTLRKTHIMSMALESKGFGNPTRTSYIQLRLSRVDYLSFLLLFSLLFLPLILKKFGI
ncbi:MAG TPA: energy-coupling factor transporter transmembrane protein EcfT [bacterium]|nr:energy-coupling factor transporter transmembrane protein EcfT [bacterium]HEX68284.1 energy-coupling factor transporter transmembrane protein EcfT [bacterium]